MTLDYWAHRHTDDPKLRDQVVNPDFEADLAALEAEDAASPAPGDWETVADDRFEG